LEEIEAEELKVYVVWGPMLGGETKGDAEWATTFLADPRVEHFWTDNHLLAELFQGPLGLENEPAWDTYLLFPPGSTWKEGVPEPSFFMHVGRSLPAERRLNGEELARQVRRLLTNTSSS